MSGRLRFIFLYLKQELISEIGRAVSRGQEGILVSQVNNCAFQSARLASDYLSVRKSHSNQNLPSLNNSAHAPIPQALAP